MSTIELNVGMASQYFMTDPGKAIAVAEWPSWDRFAKPPFLVLSRGTFGVKTCSEIMAVIWGHGASSRLFSSRKKPPEPSQLEVFLDDLIQERKPSIRVSRISDPVVVAAVGFERKALAALKVMKMKAVAPFLGVDVSQTSDSSVVVKLEEIFSADLLQETLGCKVFHPKKCCFVSGLRKTVVSNEHGSGRVLKDFPDLAGKFDPSSLNEPLI